MVLYSCVLIVFLLCQESLKLILVGGPLPKVVLSQQGSAYQGALCPYLTTIAYEPAWAVISLGEAWWPSKEEHQLGEPQPLVV
jgi:hypothetical protein